MIRRVGSLAVVGAAFVALAFAFRAGADRAEGPDQPAVPSVMWTYWPGGAQDDEPIMPVFAVWPDGVGLVSLGYVIDEIEHLAPDPIHVLRVPPDRVPALVERIEAVRTGLGLGPRERWVRRGAPHYALRVHDGGDEYAADLLWMNPRTRNPDFAYLHRACERIALDFVTANLCAERPDDERDALRTVVADRLRARGALVARWVDRYVDPPEAGEAAAPEDDGPSAEQSD